MWINRAEYEKLKSAAEDNQYDADRFRSLVKYIKEKKNVIYNDFIMTSSDIWNEILNKYNTSENRVKDIEAELEWYKVKYHEMKMNTK